jgi:hypothetical protein
MTQKTACSNHPEPLLSHHAMVNITFGDQNKPPFKAPLSFIHTFILTPALPISQAFPVSLTRETLGKGGTNEHQRQIHVAQGVSFHRHVSPSCP